MGKKEGNGRKKNGEIRAIIKDKQTNKKKKWKEEKEGKMKDHCYYNQHIN